jgi:hypothetical protein
VIDVHIPVHGHPKESATIAYITEGLDAVILSQSISRVYPGSIQLTIVGNPRDLGIAMERAVQMNGVVD